MNAHIEPPIGKASQGDSVTTSEIATQRLESAREDRLEVVELLSQTEALLEIRSNGETGTTISRAQWTALVYYLQQGSEAFSRLGASPDIHHPESGTQRFDSLIV